MGLAHPELEHGLRRAVNHVRETAAHVAESPPQPAERHPPDLDMLNFLKCCNHNN